MLRRGCESVREGSTWGSAGVVERNEKRVFVASTLLSVRVYVCVHVGTNQVVVVFATTEVGAKEGVGAEQGQEPSCRADQGYAWSHRCHVCKSVCLFVSSARLLRSLCVRLRETSV